MDVQTSMVIIEPNNAFSLVFIALVITKYGNDTDGYKMHVILWHVNAFYFILNL